MSVISTTTVLAIAQNSGACVAPSATSPTPSVVKTEPIPYGAAELKCGAFDIVAFCNAVRGAPDSKGDRVAYPTVEKVIPSAVVELAGISPEIAKAYTAEFLRDRDMVQILREAADGMTRAIMRMSGGKYGIRALSLVTNGEQRLLDCSVVRVPFVAYNLISQPGISAEQYQSAGVVGVCCTVSTADNWLMVQRRSARNANYLLQGGASVAGLLDAVGDGNGVLNELTTAVITSRFAAEAKEEAGIRANTLKEVKLQALGFDHTKPHHEFMLTAVSKLTGDEILSIARENFESKRGEILPVDFAEQILLLPNTPKVIELLLTEVRNPFPPTHAAAFLCHGRNLVQQEQGEAAARTWTERIGAACRSNYEHMDSLVRSYYQQDPARYVAVPPRLKDKYERWCRDNSNSLKPSEAFLSAIQGDLGVGFTVDDKALRVLAAMELGGIPRRNPRKYMPGYSPQEQGLPTIESEITRLNLPCRSSYSFESGL